MGNPVQILTGGIGGLIGGKKKGASEAPRAPVKQDNPRRDVSLDTSGLDADKNRKRAAARKARVQGQTQLSRSGIRTNEVKVPTRAGISIQ